MSALRAASALLLLAGPAGAWDVFDVRAFGAKGDGRSFDTVPIRAALQAAAAAGGGEVLFPRGYRFLSMPINLTPHLMLSVEGTLAFAGEPDADAAEWQIIAGFAWYSASNVTQYQPCIMGWNVDNITVTGACACVAHVSCRPRSA